MEPAGAPVTMRVGGAAPVLTFVVGSAQPQSNTIGTNVLRYFMTAYSFSLM
jgi:hypothetical protein